MIPRHHPPEAHLLAYVSGHGDPSLRALLEAHLDLCDDCAAAVADLAAPGGDLLRNLPPEPPAPDLFDRILGRLPEAGAAAAYPVPASVKALLPPDADRAWKGVLRAGVRFLELAAAEAQGVKLYLVHLSAGRVFPHHAHGGLEEAVILAGGAVDGGEVFEAGDWRTYAAGTTHDPGALPDEDCWLLTRIEDEVQLTGWRGVLQRL